MRTLIARLVRFAFTVGLIAVAFAGGWHAYGRANQQSQRFGVPIAPQIVIPSGYGVTTLISTAQSARFAPGDRVDVMIKIDGEFQPLLLDALVMQNGAILWLLVPIGDANLMNHVQAKRLPIELRPTITPTPAAYTSGYERAKRRHK